MSRQDGFTMTELLISTVITLLVTGAALTTFRNGLAINDSAAQLSDANQNLRAGTNQLIRDLMQAGRIIGPEGIPMPSGAGVAAFNRPGPEELTFSLVVDPDTTLNLPAITTGWQDGPDINGSETDIVTIMTVDEFMPTIQTPPATGMPSPIEGTIAPDGRSVTLPADSLWLTGDAINDTPPIQVGDLVLFKNPKGMALHTVTSKDSTHIFFGNNADWFKFNQFDAPQVPIILIKQVEDTTTAYTQQTTLFRALMITYYVNIIEDSPPRLTRLLNHCPTEDPTCAPFSPQALAGVVEDLDLTYDLVDGINNPTAVQELPTTIAGTTYNSNQIRKVNIHMGVRSEALSLPAQDYVRNHISTAVAVRSLASVDRYVTQ
jgi:type II secretory pathway pseudopilin PulG